MTDILGQAAAIVEGAERESMLARITELMDKYPHGMSLFICSDDDVEHATIVKAAFGPRTDASGGMGMMNVLAYNLIRDSVDWSGQ